MDYRKLCKDCAHIKKLENGYYACTNPEWRKYDIVFSGKNTCSQWLDKTTIVKER